LVRSSFSLFPFPSFSLSCHENLRLHYTCTHFFYLCLVTVEDLPHFAAPSQFHGLMHGWHFILFLGTLMIDPLFVT
jgi:hypothetical protein